MTCESIVQQPVVPQFQDGRASHLPFPVSQVTADAPHARRTTVPSSSSLGSSRAGSVAEIAGHDSSSPIIQPSNRSKKKDRKIVTSSDPISIHDSSDDEMSGIEELPPLGVMSSRTTSGSGSNHDPSKAGPRAINHVIPSALRPVADLEERLAQAVSSQSLWQGIRQKALERGLDATGPDKKLKEIETELVRIYQSILEGAPMKDPGTPKQGGEGSGACSTMNEKLRGASTAMPNSTSKRTPSLEHSDSQAISRQAGDRLRHLLAGTKGKEVITYSMHGRVQVFGTRSNACKSDVLKGHCSLEFGLRVIDACTPTSKSIVMLLERNPVSSSNAGQQVMEYKVKNNRLYSQIFSGAPHTTNPYSIAAVDRIDNGYRFVTGGTSDRTVKLWTVNENERGESSVTQIQDVHKIHQTAIRAVAFHRQRKWLLSASMREDITIYDTGSSAQKVLQLHLEVPAPIWHIHVDNDQPNIVVVEAAAFHAFDLRQKGRSILSVDRRSDGMAGSSKRTRFDKGSFQGNFIARGYQDGIVNVWDVRKPSCIKAGSIASQHRSNKDHDGTVVSYKATNDKIQHVLLDDDQLRLLTTGTTTSNLITLNFHRH